MILVTGASGYLGQHVVKALDAHGVGVFPFTSHTWNMLREGMAIPSAEAVIHCAAVVPKTPEGYDDKAAARASVLMLWNLIQLCPPRIVFASSHVAADQTNAYAAGKRACEQLGLRASDVAMRLPGLFGLPRKAGVIYEAAKWREIPDSFGPYPAMHVADAAEYLVRAATMPGDGHSEPFTVTYGDPRLEAVYGSLGVTFQQRVRELVELVRA